MKSICILLFLTINSSIAFSQSDSTIISEEEAIVIAERHGCYVERGSWTTHARYNPILNQWTVSSTKRNGNQESGQKSGKLKLIVIDASTGKILKIEKRPTVNPPGKF